MTPISGVSQEGSPPESLTGNTGVGDTRLMPEACLEKFEGEELDNDSMMQETEKAPMRRSCGPTKGTEKTQAIFCGPGGPMKGRSFDFCLKKVSSQAGFLPGPRQPQQKEVGRAECRG